MVVSLPAADWAIGRFVAEKSARNCSRFGAGHLASLRRPWQIDRAGDYSGTRLERAGFSLDDAE